MLSYIIPHCETLCKCFLENLTKKLSHIKAFRTFSLLQVSNSRDGKLRTFATVYEPVSGRTLEAMTDLPGVQLYCGNFLDGTFTGKNGKKIEKHNGFCLETQFYPDTPNQPSFPKCVYKAGSSYESTTIYKFGVKKD